MYFRKALFLMMGEVSTPPQSNQINPKRIVDTLLAYRNAAALNTAIELDLFTRIAHGTNTASKIAAELGIPVRSLRILCDFLVTTGLLLREDEEYGLAADVAVYLDKKSPEYLGDSAAILYSPDLLESFGNLTETVRAGLPVKLKGTPPTVRPQWFDLVAGTGTNAALAAEVFAEAIELPSAQPLKVLDACASEGYFGIAVARRYPSSVVVALDHGEALATAQENADKAKLGTRFQNIPGDPLLTETGTGYDAVIVGNELFRFDTAQLNLMFKRFRAALKEQGQLFILEHLADDNPESAGLRLNVLASTRRGDLYTVAEAKALLDACLFKSIKTRELPAAGAVLVTARP